MADFTFALLGLLGVLLAGASASLLGILPSGQTCEPGEPQVSSGAMLWMQHLRLQGPRSLYRVVLVYKLKCLNT